MTSLGQMFVTKAYDRKEATMYGMKGKPMKKAMAKKAVAKKAVAKKAVAKKAAAKKASKKMPPEMLDRFKKMGK